MSLLIGIFVALIIIGVLLWGISRILSVVAVPEPFKTILWVVVVVIAVLVFVDVSGIHHFDLR